jgi:hypothetical protein
MNNFKNMEKKTEIKTSPKSIKIDTILLPKELTVDSIVSLAIVYKYCKKKMTGLSKAKLEFRASLPEGKVIEYYLRKGILPLIPLSENVLVLEQVANCGISSLHEYPIVNQVITTLRDKSHAPDERGLIFSWNYLTEILKDNPPKIFSLVLPILKEYIEYLEDKRVEFLEYCQGAIEKGKLTSFVTYQNQQKLKVVFIAYNSDDIVKYLFYKKEVMADVVVLFKEKGEIFIKAREDKQIDLMDVVAILRVETARHKKIPFDKINKHVLNRSGVMEGIEYWNFEPTAHRIRSVKHSNLDKLTIKKALIIGLDIEKMAKGECPPQIGCKGKKCSYYSYNMLRCRKRRAGAKDNYQPKEKSTNKNIRVYRK